MKRLIVCLVAALSAAGCSHGAEPPIVGSLTPGAIGGPTSAEAATRVLASSRLLDYLPAGATTVFAARFAELSAAYGPAFEGVLRSGAGAGADAPTAKGDAGKKGALASSQQTRAATTALRHLLDEAAARCEIGLADLEEVGFAAAPERRMLLVALRFTDDVTRGERCLRKLAERVTPTTLAGAPADRLRFAWSGALEGSHEGAAALELVATSAGGVLLVGTEAAVADALGPRAREASFCGSSWGVRSLLCDESYSLAFEQRVADSPVRAVALVADGDAGSVRLRLRLSLDSSAAADVVKATLQKILRDALARDRTGALGKLDLTVERHVGAVVDVGGAFEGPPREQQRVGEALAGVWAEVEAARAGGPGGPSGAGHVAAASPHAPGGTAPGAGSAQAAGASGVAARDPKHGTR